MELTGDVLIGAPRAKVWAGLNDPDTLTRCIPGCEGMEVVSPTERTARVAVKVGPVRARFAGRIRMDDVRPEQGCVLHFEGSGGAAGMARGQSSVELADEDGGTRLRYTTQASVGGKLGQVGGRMMDAAAKQMADQFFAALNAQLAPAPAVEAAEPVATTAAATHAAAPSSTPAVAMRPMLPMPVPSAAVESARVLWFSLGSLSTALGVWIGWMLFA
jgi:uncharacterized protein